MGWVPPSLSLSLIIQTNALTSLCFDSLFCRKEIMMLSLRPAKCLTDSECLGGTCYDCVVTRQASPCSLLSPTLPRETDTKE